MLRIGVEETVSISVFDVNGEVDIQLQLQDFPNRRKTFSQVSGKFRECTQFIFTWDFFLFLLLLLEHLLIVFHCIFL